MTLRERVVASVSDIRDRGQRLVQLNLELLTGELKAKGRKFGAAIGLFVGAGVLAFYAVGFALATIAAALALVVPLWLSLLIVTVVIVLIIAVMVAVGRSQLEKARTPPPDTALAEARKTADLVKTNLRQTKAGVRAKVAFGRAAPSAPPREPVPSPPSGPPPESPAESPSAPPGSPSAPPSDDGARES